ncbi:MAG: exodeoxyribonuclease III [Candidatus Paceibacterota bacterium]|jgi:exodeoxyribonuclease-3
MKIISWNVNGLRSVHKKGFLNWFKRTNADIVCLQEIKIQEDKIPQELLSPDKYHSYFNFAEKRGYSGVACYVKKIPLKVEYKLGIKRFDKEGRFLSLEYPEFTLINFYLPHGGRQKENLVYKLEVYDKLIKYLGTLKNKKVILIGDFNIAHQEIDLARPKQNQKNIMFTPEERKQIGRIIDLGFIDTFREFHKDGGNYTWWPYMANARERNLGWRIDYSFTSKNLTPEIKDVYILKKVYGSDHCPIGLEVKI